MLRALLEDRFKLREHRETRQMPVDANGNSWLPVPGERQPLGGESSVSGTGVAADAARAGVCRSAHVVTALQDQLGVKLEARQALVEVLVIDSVELPTPDLSRVE